MWRQPVEDGSVDFHCDWADYQAGFGNLLGKFLLGNNSLPSLMETGNGWQLRMDLEDMKNKKAGQNTAVSRSREMATD